MKGLENESHAMSPKTVEILLARQGLTVEMNFALVGSVEGTQQIEQGRFAAAAGAHDGQILSAPHRQ